MQTQDAITTTKQLIAKTETRCSQRSMTSERERAISPTIFSAAQSRGGVAR